MPFPGGQEHARKAAWDLSHNDIYEMMVTYPTVSKGDHSSYSSPAQNAGFMADAGLPHCRYWFQRVKNVRINSKQYCKVLTICLVKMVREEQVAVQSEQESKDRPPGNTQKVPPEKNWQWDLAKTPDLVQQWLSGPTPFVKPPLRNQEKASYKYFELDFFFSFCI